MELHGNLTQNARSRNLFAFSNGTVRTLVATDIAARGIHVDDVNLVIHADPPLEHKAYLHRSGRTARAGAIGTVITLMTEEVRTAVDRVVASEAGDIPAEKFLAPRHADLDSEVASAIDIRLVGVTLTRTVRDLLPVLDRRLPAGARIQVILIDVESPARTEAVARSRKADTPEFYQHRLSSTVDLLRLLASAPVDPSALELRVLPFVPTFGMCLIDPQHSHGRAHIEVYQHRTLEPNPSFSLRADRDGHWYALFAGQFDTLWESARRIPLVTG